MKNVTIITAKNHGKAHGISVYLRTGTTDGEMGPNRRVFNIKTRRGGKGVLAFKIDLEDLTNTVPAKDTRYTRQIEGDYDAIIDLAAKKLSVPTEYIVKAIEAVVEPEETPEEAPAEA